MMRTPTPPSAARHGSLCEAALLGHLASLQLNANLLQAAKQPGQDPRPSIRAARPHRQVAMIAHSG
jgi:hypothetical protein